MNLGFQLKLLYFQLDKALININVISTFHIIVIIYQSFDVKYFEIFEKSSITTQFRAYFSYPIILHIFSQILCSTYNKLNEMHDGFKFHFKEVF
jgi:hypothetical protein